MVKMARSALVGSVPGKRQRLGWERKVRSREDRVLWNVPQEKEKKEETTKWIKWPGEKNEFAAAECSEARQNEERRSSQEHGRARMAEGEIGVAYVYV